MELRVESQELRPPSLFGFVGRPPEIAVILSGAFRRNAQSKDRLTSPESLEFGTLSGFGGILRLGPRGASLRMTESYESETPYIWSGVRVSGNWSRSDPRIS